jgi:catechol 2,3-dioxygenase-like lactoylglutathione lyase family enzyme
MSDPKPAATISAAEPQLFVADIAASCRFFTDKLGFAIAFTYGSPPFYAQVVRDGARLNMRHVDQPVIDPIIRDREELLSASMTVETATAIKQLFLEFQAAGVTFHQALQRQPWGADTFIIKDPDGNLLLFAGPAA